MNEECLLSHRGKIFSLMCVYQSNLEDSNPAYFYIVFIYMISNIQIYKNALIIYSVPLLIFVLFYIFCFCFYSVNMLFLYILQRLQILKHKRLFCFQNFTLYSIILSIHYFCISLLYFTYSFYVQQFIFFLFLVYFSPLLKIPLFCLQHSLTWE